MGREHKENYTEAIDKTSFEGGEVVEAISVVLAENPVTKVTKIYLTSTSDASPTLRFQMLQHAAGMIGK